MLRAAGAEFFSGFVSLCLALVLRLFEPALLRFAFALFFELVPMCFACAVFLFEPALLFIALLLLFFEPALLRLAFALFFEFLPLCFVRALFFFEPALLCFAHCLALALSRFVFASLLFQNAPARHCLRRPTALLRDVRRDVCIGCGNPGRLLLGNFGDAS
ncbi:MAG: hypothetical protein U5K56_19880 [Halioglobus sp.]|nr:hypothetical protein [Halioglobus sp.]